jgi:hypothetical protein
MAPGQERFAMLEARCSPSARELLRGLRGHSKFSELISKLEPIEGTLFSGDIEETFVALIKGSPSPDKSRPL